MWEVLSDLEGVAEWNPGIDRAECLADTRRGLGARRRCFMHPSGWMTETVTEWQSGELIAFSVEDAPPLKEGMARFMLTDHGLHTRLEASFGYQVKLGPLGPVIDRLIVHRQLHTSWRQSIEGLRNHSESLARTARQN